MNYKTHTPHKDLRSFVKCFWTLEAASELNQGRQRIVPDGCMEMIFHYGDVYRQYLDDGSSIIQPKSFVFGQITKPLEIEPTGGSGIFSVRFHPDGFIPFATRPVNEMENKAVALHDVFGEEGRLLEHAVLNSLSDEQRIVVAESFLLSKLMLPEAIDRIAKLSVEVMMQLNGQLSVEELSAHLQVSRRQLERRFSSVIGLSPKQLSKIIRLQSVMKLLVNKQFTSLTELAYEGEYYDQAHFIRDFKEFTGISPKNFYNNNLKMASLFSEGG